MSILTTDLITGKQYLLTGDFSADVSGKADLSGATFTGQINGTSMDLSGNLNVDGMINVVNSEFIYSENDFIFMRSGNTLPIAIGEVSGLAVLNVDGSGKTAVFGATYDGMLRVGWSGDTLVAIAGREDTPLDGGYAYWDAATSKFITYDLGSDVTGLTQTIETHTGNTNIHFEMSDITGFTKTSDVTGLTETVSNHTGDTDIHYVQSAITITQNQVTDLSNDLGILNNGITGNTESIDGHTGNTDIHYAQSAITITQNQVTDLTNDLSSKANLSGDTFTGDVTAPTFIGDLTGTASSANTATHALSADTATTATPIDSSVTYNKIGTDLTEITIDNTGTIDCSTSGIISCTPTGPINFVVTNLKQNKTQKVFLVNLSGYTIGVSSSFVHESSNIVDYSAAGLYYLYFDIWNASSGTEDVFLTASEKI